ALGGWHQLASAQASWPEKPVRLLLSQPAGSGPDAMARMIGDLLARKWNQPIVVENRPGGQNAIGAQAAAKSPADGYTLYLATAAALVTNTYLFKTLPYDPRKDFTPVGMVGKVPFALTVNNSLPVRNLQEFIAYAKANPTKVAVANEGPKTFSGMMTRLLAHQLGIDVVQVPYVSVGGAVTDTVGGLTHALVSDVPAVNQMVKAGRLRPLAVTTAKRVAGWDSTPSFSEVLPGFDYAGWIAIVAPTGTPAAAIQRFNRDLEAILSDKDVAARLLAIGPMTEGAGTPEQMAAFLQREHARWSTLSKDIGILPE
ncbi:MAG TPA: tripartite tricarboxylate transporter substrate binding protein, partial [Ramlibacter sp.]|nr:tripartite tricarboxylate transporter substrate binding protein [Ramlibacter sp.]